MGHYARLKGKPVLSKRKHRLSLKSGAKTKHFTLKKEIGTGGNGDVWKASKDGHEDFAVKILRELTGISYKRFRNEIRALDDNKDIQGIIPMVAHHFPDDLSEGKPWYVMPLADPCIEYLEKKSPEEIVEHFVKLADTLSELHSRGIAHRDIKPENILALHGRLCFSDFGLVKYPEQAALTPERRDVGPKFTMAPEMRRRASQADGQKADVFSFSKTLWIALTKQFLGFDGHYVANSDLGLKNFLGDFYLSTLDDLIADCTVNDPSTRPTMPEVSHRLKEWLDIVASFQRRNKSEWSELLNRLFPITSPTRATWTDVNDILAVLNEVGKIRALNHMFLPSGGGNTLTRAERAREEGFIVIYADLAYILKPLKLTFESFNFSPQWSYIRLEAKSVEPTGICDIEPDAYSEALTELHPGDYREYGLWEYAGDLNEPLPKSARPVSRFLRGSFVIFSTSSPYNQDPSTYDARHEKMGEKEFREYIAKHSAEPLSSWYK